MPLKLKLTIYAALPICSFYLLHRFPIDYRYTDFQQSVSILIAVSTMVFTIMGIWIALLYPNAMKRIVDPSKNSAKDFSESLEETKRLEAIVGSVLKSVIALLGIMLIYLFKLLLANTAFYYNYLIIIKNAALSSLILLSWLQIEAIFHVGHANFSFLNDLHKKREEREAENDI